MAILGAGPGGYTAAFRAADLGKKVILIERYPVLGGVCLNVGCIPSKALLHMAKVVTDAEETIHAGINLNTPKLELNKLRKWKESIIEKLTNGLTALAKKRNVEVIQGNGKFITPNMISVTTPNGQKTVSFEHCVIAAGSSVAHPPGVIQNDPRIIDSTGALELEDIPVDEILFNASRNIVDAIEVMDPSKQNPMVQPWLQQALIWAVGGLGYSKDDAAEMLTREL